MVNEPKLWDKLLAESPKGSVLMGGAVIDYMFATHVNDYDIFYSYQPGVDLNIPANWTMTEVKFNDPEWIKAHEEAYLQGVDENGANPISTVYEYLVDGEHKVQLIGVNYDNPLKHMRNFDHSLTLGSYTKNGMTIHRKVFESIDNHTVTYVSKNHDLHAVTRSLERAQKKTLKMPFGDWQYVGFFALPKKVEHWDFAN